MRWADGAPDEELRGVAFVWRPYRAYSPTWGHDHCEVCMAAFSENHPEDLHEGFTTTSEFPAGAEYAWVCRECFEAERNDMGWREVDDERAVRPPGLEMDESGHAPKQPRLRD